MKLKTPKKPKKTIVKNMDVYFLIDESGSMQGLNKNVVTYINEQLTALKEEQDLKIKGTIITFNQKVDTICDSEDIEDIEFDNNSYNPNGGTCLNDALHEVLYRNTNPNNPSLLVLVTDGEENTSRINTPTVFNLIKQAMDSDKWTIGVACPAFYKGTIERNYGIRPGCITVWEASSAGVQKLSTSNMRATRSLVKGYKSGITSSSNYWSPDLSVTSSQIKSNLTDVSKNFNVFTVPVKTKKDQLVIANFVNKVLKRKFEVGSVYYQHTKTEKVQDYKDIILKRTKDGKLFSGDNVRDLISIPEGGTISLAPGWSTEYTLFIRSTSWNRNLVPGTEILMVK